VELVDVVAVELVDVVAVELVDTDGVDAKKKFVSDDAPS
jgi:hypothetical protein